MDLQTVAGGGKGALARALAQLERHGDDPTSLALLDAAYRAPRGRVVGLTGPPGVGKSTLTGALIAALRARGQRVAVIAVDPSSRLSGGALLGDRTRIDTDPDDHEVFVRSMAARDHLGGLAPQTVAAMVLMRALYDLVLIETVGVGQSETDVAMVADTVVFCIQPGSGDSLQFMKAGIAEIPDICVVTKADLGAVAVRAAADMRAALGLAGGAADWQVPVVGVAAAERDGIAALLAALDAHADHQAQAGRGAARRTAQAVHWLESALRERFGSEGVARAGAVSLAADETPFDRLAEIGAALRAKLDR